MCIRDRLVATALLVGDDDEVTVRERQEATHARGEDDESTLSVCQPEESSTCLLYTSFKKIILKLVGEAPAYELLIK